MTQAIALDHYAVGATDFDPEVKVRRDVRELLDRGLGHCRRGEWGPGLHALVEVAEHRRPRAELPSLYYSYLGRAMAVHERRVREGLRLCRHALKMEFYQPESYVNLARVCLMADRRREAWRAVDHGLAVDDDHPELLALRRELGARRPPVLRLLSRRNPINRLLGRLRYGLGGQAKDT